MKENPNIKDKIPKSPEAPNPELLGTIIGQLREQPENPIRYETNETNKRKLSPTNQTQNKQKKITPHINSFNKWGILVDSDDLDTIQQIERNTSTGSITQQPNQYHNQLNALN